MGPAPPHASALWSALLAVPLPVVVLDADARIQLANDAATARWPTARRGSAFEEALAPETRPEVGAVFARVRYGGGPATVRVPVGRFGEPALELACMPVEGGGFVLVGTDLLSHREQEREALSRRERDRVVSEKMQAVAQLAGGVAHDLNNALAVILPNADALVDQLPPRSDVQNQAAEIAEAARQASHVVTQLTALGLRQPASARAVDVAELSTSHVGALQRLVGGTVTLEASTQGHVGSALVDPGHLEQILSNLVLNAADAMPSGGVVRVTVCARDVGPAYAEAVGVPPGDYVAIEVKDEGHGISESVLPRIFEPFFTTRGGGAHAGLGLAAVLGLVRQARGGVTVDSVEGGGALFTVLLPKLVAAPGDVPVGERKRTVQGSPRILLVDDEPNVRSALARLLGRHGFDVTVAEGGFEALDIVRRDRGLRAVLSDIVMPDMNGIALARAVSAVRPDLPMVLMSGYTSDGTSALEELGVPFLQKPFSGADVVRTLLDVIDASKARASLALGSGMPPSFAPESGQLRRDDMARDPYDADASEANEAGDVTRSVRRTETRRS